LSSQNQSCNPQTHIGHTGYIFAKQHSLGCLDMYIHLSSTLLLETLRKSMYNHQNRLIVDNRTGKYRHLGLQ
jgi:hypothetical protein